jgi:predicted AlkP superfamily pyrophosphatase or phosphodiesterase
MKKVLTVLLLLSLVISATAQSVPRPKLVVGIVIDQMRWDYLYRYYDRYPANGGFKRMMNQGFSCENTLIPYTPTITACGHSTIYTGSVPALTGISGNFWYDRDKLRNVYCTEDNSVTTVGSSSTLGKMSPKNMLVTSICDELRLATNFRSKVIGIAIKDRGGILPAGHSANAAYWYDNTIGSWITSTYYMKDLPGWVSDFNSKKLVDKYFTEGWSLLYPANTYLQSTEDEKSYESKPFGASKFPYDLKSFIGKNYGLLPVIPAGNTYTAEFAKAAVVGEQLGADNITDFLAVSFSAPDYIGHAFGPNSMEEEDNYLRLDKEIGGLLDFLDTKVGKNQYTVFLSADHGVTQTPEFMLENKLPAGRVFMTTIMSNLNKTLKAKYNISNLIVSDENYQLTLNHFSLDSAKMDSREIKQLIIDSLSAQKGIFRVFALDDLNSVPLPARIREMLNNGYNPHRNGDIQVMLLPQYIDAYSTTGTTHGLWNPYDAHIPLLWYGWGIKQGKLNRETYMTDIAPTIAALLHIQMPSGCVGHVIEDVLK